MVPINRPASTQRVIPRWLLVAVGALILIRIGTSFLPERKPASLVRWVEAAEAQKRAAASGKLIMYDFSAAWCGPCRSMERTVFADRSTAMRINDLVIPVHVVDRQQEDGRNSPLVAELQKKYGIRAFPTIVIADATGKQMANMEGFRGKPAFDKLLNDANPFSPFRKR